MKDDKKKRYNIRIFLKRETSSFFFKKINEHEKVCFWKVECRIVFSFEKPPKMRKSQEEIWTTESTNKFFWPLKGNGVFPKFFQKQVSLFRKIDNRKLLRNSRICPEKNNKKEVKEQKSSGYETILIGVYAQVAVHNTVLTKHAIWFLTKLSAGLKLLFSCAEWWEKANASRQGHWPPNRFTAYCRTSTVSDTLNWGELVVASHTAMYWICGTTTVFCTTFEQHHVHNDQLDSPDYSLPVLLQFSGRAFWSSFGFFTSLDQFWGASLKVYEVVIAGFLDRVWCAIFSRTPRQLFSTLTVFLILHISDKRWIPDLVVHCGSEASLFPSTARLNWLWISNRPRHVWSASAATLKPPRSS